MEPAPKPAPAVGEEERLMLQVAQGDRTAFAALYDRFSVPIYSLILKMLSNEAEAQDLLQEVFLSIWNKASRYQPQRGTAFSWIAAQARNRAIDRLRSRRRHGELVDLHRTELEPSGSAVLSSDAHAQLAERGRFVKSALAELSAEQRQVLCLAYFDGLTQAEIAKKLAAPLGTIKARAHRGLARLREALGFLHE